MLMRVGRSNLEILARWTGIVFLCLLILPARPGAADSDPSSAIYFRFPEDAFAYANELASSYEWDPNGKMIQHPKAPRPEFTLRCFVVARTARQFRQHARFEPNEPKATCASYKHLIRLVLRRSPRHWSAAHDRIAIPGYANLREFSMEQEALLKEASGGAWQSYFQRGNWRMIFPFSRRHQQRTAERLAQELQKSRPPIVHLVCFPSLTLNHAVLLFDYKWTSAGFSFSAYDPNDPERPTTLSYREAQRSFHFSSTPYFAGGPVKVYEVYRGLGY